MRGKWSWYLRAEKGAGQKQYSDYLQLERKKQINLIYGTRRNS